MNKLSKLVCFILIGSAVFMAGCPKKPKRPDPSATTAGMGPGGISTTPIDTGANANGLEANTAAAGHLDEANLDRTALPTIYFDFDRSGIKASERPKLEQAAKKIASDFKGKQILLEGHCDWRGTAEYNMGLGDRRANAVKEYLEKLGVAATTLEPLSKGDLDAKENASGEEMTKDRRVEIVVIKQ